VRPGASNQEPTGPISLHFPEIELANAVHSQLPAAVCGDRRQQSDGVLGPIGRGMVEVLQTSEDGDIGQSKPYLTTFSGDIIPSQLPVSRITITPRFG
jgi:hypothetical protein